MTTPLVFPPLRQETLLSIRGRLEADLNAGRDPNAQNFWDLTPGSVASDLLMTAALELERLWDFTSIDAPAASLVEFAWGTYLDAHGLTVGVERTQAAPAHGELTFTGPGTTLIPVGTEVGTELEAAEEEPPSFRTTEGGVIPGGEEEEGSITLTAEAVMPGSAGNIAKGAAVEMLTEIEEVTVTNEEAFTDGEDVETDESYRERLSIAYSAARGGGSVDDLRAWSLGFPGVGFVRIVPLWAGAGTVRVIVTDVNNDPVSSTVETALQHYLDPVSAETKTSEKVVLPVAVIKVPSTAGFAATGRIVINGQVVTYTSITATEFKGCTGGEGEQAASSPVQQQGLGRGMGPPGSIITVDTPSKLAVAVEVEVELDDGYTFTGEEGSVDLTEEVTEALSDYIDSLPPGGEDPPGEEIPAGSGTVLLNRVRQFILAIDGTYDVPVVKLNGVAANLAVGALQVPHLGTVTLKEK
jgi:uncharacterized phage protein gp47/JayE